MRYHIEKEIVTVGANGDVVVSTLNFYYFPKEKIKEEIKTDTEDFLNENFEALDDFSFDDTIKVIMDKVEALLDEMIKVGS